jgi:hypothetical protein
MAFRQWLRPINASICDVSEIRCEKVTMEYNTVTDPELLAAGFDTTGHRIWVYYFDVAYRLPNGKIKVRRKEDDLFTSIEAKQARNLEHLEYNRKTRAGRQWPFRFSR